MKIGELAKAARCTVETVRYYEKEGLLSKPDRTAGNYRSYGAAHLERLCFIRNCRALDMSHEEIRALLGAMDRPSADCSPINVLLDRHIAHVDRRISELVRLKEQLTVLRGDVRRRIRSRPVAFCKVSCACSRRPSHAVAVIWVSRASSSS
jgi:Cd(II)/Pb(II)-responsive transcriptional regulator